MANNPVSSALASILHSGRSDFNARFAAARRLYPDLHPEPFTNFLRTNVDDLVQSVEKVHPERLADVTNAAYDAALELVGQKLAGEGARLLVMEEGWQRILPRIASLVAAGPARIIPAVCNAIHQLASTPAARPKEWIEIMERLGPECANTEAFLKLGQVAAWRAGLAHFRQGAIAAAGSLPEHLTLSALGAEPNSTWPTVSARLLDDPWFDPSQAGMDSAPIRVAAQVGSFRGFGGLFVEPPRVVSSGDHFLTRSGNECWLLTADAFGATFHRAAVKEFEESEAQSAWPSGFRIAGSRVLFNGVQFELPSLGNFTGAAANTRTLALTSRLTHSIILVALKGDELRRS